MTAPRYLVAKYIPDLQRMEPRNIGVIVWTPDAVEARFLGEKPERPGVLDGRSIPGFVTSASAYRQWISYWRDQLQRLEIFPAMGGAKVSRRSPDYVRALMAANRGNFSLIDGGVILESIDPDSLADVVDLLFASLVKSTGLEETRDLSFDEICAQLIEESRLLTNPLFRYRYVVNCPIGATAEEFEFSYGLGNGVPFHLLHRVALPKSSRKLRLKNVNDAAWMFEKVVQANLINRDAARALVFPTAEQRDDQEIERYIQVLGTVARICDLNDYDAVKADISGLSITMHSWESEEKAELEHLMEST
jgi:hypothetical protein